MSVVIGASFRSVRTWSLEGVSTTAGAVELTRGVPDSFEAAYRCHIPESYRTPPRKYRLATATVREAVPAGATVAFDIVGTLADHAGVTPTVGVWLQPPGEEPSQVGDNVELENVAGDPASLLVRARPEPERDGRHRVVVSAVDEAMNPVPSFADTVEFGSRGPGALGALPSTATPDDDGRVVLELIVRRGPVRLLAEAADRGLTATGPALFAETPGPAGHYYGGIHFHTRHSHDGDRAVADAYRYARDHLNLDVVAATDHTPGTAAWEHTLEANERHYEPGRFVTIPAWEWSAVEGHANVYLRSPAVDAGPAVADPMETPSYGHFDTDYGDDPTVHPTALDWPEDALLVPHHTGAGDGDPWGPWNWDRHNDRISAVELVQRRGSFETDETDDDWGIRFAADGASVRDALEAGYRLGFVAGTDNHQGFPTVLPAGVTGLTCFAASARTREAVWDAMDERRTYATSGVPILCQYAVNGHPFGAAATLAREQVTFSAELHGTAPIERVDVVSGGETVWHRDPDEEDVVIEEEPLPAPEGESAYYYLRLRQVDGHRAWVSPVWLDRD